jgi:hypothetical protein
MLGFDIDAQQDDRERFLTVRGALHFDQREEPSTRGVRVQDKFSLGEHVEIILGLCCDRMELDMEDRFLRDGDQTEALAFDELNLMAGIICSP